MMGIGLAVVSAFSGRPGISQEVSVGLDDFVRLTASDVPPETFGVSVSASGDTVVVGAPSGAYVFSRNHGGANAWGQVTRLTPAAPAEYLGYRVALDGDLAVVGANADDHAGRYSGSAFVFERHHTGENAWGQVAKLVADDAAEFDQFGLQVAVSGDTIIAGARQNDDAGTNSGSAYIFNRDHGGTNAWGQVMKLTASDAAAYDYFGSDVSISGDVALVGASQDDDAGTNSGSAYFFDRDHGGENAWGQVTKIVGAAAGDFFGSSVDLEGDLAIVGSLLTNRSAYIFNRNHGGTDAWGLVAHLFPPDDSLFGVSVAISGEDALVGAVYHGCGDYCGKAYLFVRAREGWEQAAGFVSPHAGAYGHFGSAVAVSDGLVVVGMHGAGAAYLYPTLASPIFSDGFESGDMSRWSVTLN